MESFIAPKLRLLKRFQYWTVAPSYEHPGSCVISPNRVIETDKELNSDERIELFEVIVPELEAMFKEMLGDCSIDERWKQDRAYHLKPLSSNNIEISAETSYQLFEALLAAAA